MVVFSADLKRLGFEPITSRLSPSERLVADYENQFGLTLPADYRAFLAENGGQWGSSICPVPEPTPFGPYALYECLYGFMLKDRRGSDIRWVTSLHEELSNAVPIAHGSFGGEVWLLREEEVDWYVYYFDGEQRSLWPDEEFYRRFEALSPEIEEYLYLRRQGKLPRKREGYESLYFLAKSFKDFLVLSQRWDD